MPLYNRLKEYRAKIKVNQTEMGNLVGVFSISYLSVKDSEGFKCKCRGNFQL